MILIYLICALNLVTFIVYGVDKFKAKRHLWRIPESVLILFATLLFGSYGAGLGMLIWHHKTSKPKFFLTVLLFLIIHSVLLFLYVKTFLL